MLKYISVFSVISVCLSMPSALDYTELIFIQRSPVSSFYVLRNDLQNEGRTPEESNEYLQEHSVGLIMTNASRWIIHGLDAYNEHGHWLISCTDLFGHSLEYRNMIPDQNFREELKSYWPCTYAGVTTSQNWAAAYDYSGSCIYSNPTAYFQNAMQLLNRYNMGDILHSSGIVLGSSHSKEYIIHAITQHFGFRPFLKCHPAQNSHIQYILEIHICFNRGYALRHCHYNFNDVCEDNKDIVYPDWPRN